MRIRFGGTLRVAWLVAGVGCVAIVVVALAIAFRIRVTNEWQQYASLPEAKPPGRGDTVLVFAPHSDDETLGCGGMLRTAVNNGARARVVLITNGDGYRIGVARVYNSVRVTPEMCIRYAYLRQKETLAALAVLGIHREDVAFLGYPDRGIARLWDRYWGDDTLYLSHATHTDHSPYSNSFTPRAAYSGESLIADIERVLKRDRPTDVYVPHPYDNHPDHYATYCFVTAAVEQLKSERVDFAAKIKVHTYLVHRGDWPIPKGDHPEDPLSPPHAMASGDTKWSSLKLDPNVTSLKRAAIKKYASQLSIERAFLMSFARENEVFGELPVHRVEDVRSGRITIDGEPEDWFGIPPAVVDPIGDYVVAGMSRGGDVRAVYLCDDNSFIYVRLDCVRRLSSRVTYTFNFRGLSDTNSNDRYTVTICPPRRGSPRNVRWAYKGNVIEFKLPRDRFQLDESVYVQVVTKLMRLTVDNTGWHNVDFGGRAGR